MHSNTADMDMIRSLAHALHPNKNCDDFPAAVDKLALLLNGTNSKLWTQRAGLSTYYGTQEECVLACCSWSEVLSNHGAVRWGKRIEDLCSRLFQLYEKLDEEDWKAVRIMKFLLLMVGDPTDASFVSIAALSGGEEEFLLSLRQQVDCCVQVHANKVEERESFTTNESNSVPYDLHECDVNSDGEWVDLSMFNEENEATDSRIPSHSNVFDSNEGDASSLPVHSSLTHNDFVQSSEKDEHEVCTSISKERDLINYYRALPFPNACDNNDVSSSHVVIYVAPIREIDLCFEILASFRGFDGKYISRPNGTDWCVAHDVRIKSASQSALRSMTSSLLKLSKATSCIRNFHASTLFSSNSQILSSFQSGLKQWLLCPFDHFVSMLEHDLYLVLSNNSYSKNIRGTILDIQKHVGHWFPIIQRYEMIIRRLRNRLELKIPSPSVFSMACIDSVFEDIDTSSSDFKRTTRCIFISSLITYIRGLECVFDSRSSKVLYEKCWGTCIDEIHEINSEKDKLGVLQAYLVFPTFLKNVSEVIKQALLHIHIIESIKGERLENHFKEKLSILIETALRSNSFSSSHDVSHMICSILNERYLDISRQCVKMLLYDFPDSCPISPKLLITCPSGQSYDIHKSTLLQYFTGVRHLFGISDAEVWGACLDSLFSYVTEINVDSARSTLPLNLTRMLKDGLESRYPSISFQPACSYNKKSVYIVTVERLFQTAQILETEINSTLMSPRFEGESGENSTECSSRRLKSLAFLKLSVDESYWLTKPICDELNNVFTLTLRIKYCWYRLSEKRWSARRCEVIPARPSFNRIALVELSKMIHVIFCFQKHFYTMINCNQFPDMASCNTFEEMQSLYHKVTFEMLEGCLLGTNPISKRLRSYFEIVMKNVIAYVDLISFDNDLTSNEKKISRIIVRDFNTHLKLFIALARDVGSLQHLLLTLEYNTANSQTFDYLL